MPFEPDHLVRFDPAKSADPPTRSGRIGANASIAFCEALRVAIVSALALI